MLLMHSIMGYLRTGNDASSWAIVNMVLRMLPRHYQPNPWNIAWVIWVNPMVSIDTRCKVMLRSIKDIGPALFLEWLTPFVLAAVVGIIP